MSHSHFQIPATQTLLYATAESGNHAYLAHATGSPVVANARELAAVDAQHLVIVPASTSRDLTATTQAAQALQWMKKHDPDRTLLLAEPLSGDTYAIAQMRHHLRKLAGEADAVIFISATVDPFADAELFRRVRLARQFSEDLEVEIAFDDVAAAPNSAWPMLGDAEERLRKLGCRHIRKVRADLYSDPEGQQVGLFKETALRAAVVASVEKARHRAAHGEDGIEAGLLADHGAGFAHSHGDEEGEGHSHAHPHGHHHSYGAHSHGQHSHTHSHHHHH